MKMFFQIQKSFLLIIGGLAGTAGASDFPTTFNQAQYDRVFPQSVKFCAMTRVHKKGQEAGGPFAHSVLYFRNACIDKNYPYPQIRKCDSTDPIQGVGVSVNKIFKNVNWVAIPGSELFFYGNLKDPQQLNQAIIEKNTDNTDIVSLVESMGIYQGIELKDKIAVQRLPGFDETRYKIGKSIDTDFAINFGREIYCVNVPLNEKLLDRGIEFVNLANIAHADPLRLKSYELQHIRDQDIHDINLIDKKAQKEGRASEYNWNGISENCAHLAYNLFAAMGLVKPKKVKARFFVLRNMAVPADRWVELIEKANSGWKASLDEVLAIWRSSRERTLLEEQGILIKHFGVIAEHIPMHAQERNDLYLRTEKMAVLNPLHLGKLHEYADVRPAKLYSLEENIKYFEKVYNRALSQSIKLSNLSLEREEASKLEIFIEKYQAALKKNLELISKAFRTLSEQ